jgi:hypothetical protein
MVTINGIIINKIVIYYNLTYSMKMHLMALNGYSDSLPMRAGGGAVFWSVRALLGREREAGATTVVRRG